MPLPASRWPRQTPLAPAQPGAAHALPRPRAAPARREASVCVRWRFGTSFAARTKRTERDRGGAFQIVPHTPAAFVSGPR